MERGNLDGDKAMNAAELKTLCKDYSKTLHVVAYAYPRKGYVCFNGFHCIPIKQAIEKMLKALNHPAYGTHFGNI